MIVDVVEVVPTGLTVTVDVPAQPAVIDVVAAGAPVDVIEVFPDRVATLIVPVPFGEWPPTAPMSDTLYLRLAP